MQLEEQTKALALNAAQKQAVEATEGPLLVLAGAGTGKTLVLINRIVHILQQNKASHSQILATTFTNKAANEMRIRIFNMHPYQLPWLGTFHSIASKILRINAAAANLSENFSILDADDQTKLVKIIMSDLNIDSKQFNPKIVAATIQRWKDISLGPDQVTNTDLKSEFQRVSFRVYKVYQSKLSLMDAVDFGDLLLKNIEIFRKNAAILESYQANFKYLMVDEYQDTNTAQYIWLRMLAQPRHNICCVGDDDQSIYGWRGAEVGNILRFEEDFQEAQIVKLEQNYRSTGNILKAASSLIANNNMRHGKTLWTEAKSEGKVVIKSCWNDKEEANFIANEVKLSGRVNNTTMNKNTILVRAIFQTRIIEESFINHLIPYKVIGSLKFYERQEIKDILAYIRLSVKQNDDLSFERIINKPARSIGKTSIQKIRDVANDTYISLFSAAEHILVNTNLLGNKTRNSLKAFLNLIKKWQSEFQLLNHVEMAKRIIEESGYKDMLSREETVESSTKLENLRELTKALEDFSNITEFLEHISLISDNDSRAKPEDVVNIMTLHAAKGLEFDTVFLPGWEEGLFPHPKAIDEMGQKGLEEERRLAYVGITRAKRKLYISYALSRRMYNQWNNPLPSRFLKEIPRECCLVIEGSSNSRY